MNQLHSYLNALVNEKIVSSPLASTAWRWWQNAEGQFVGQLPVPSAAPGPDGQILYTWDKGENHLEVEFCGAEPATLFHMNRITGAASERTLSDHLKAEEKDLFSLFLNSDPKNRPQSGLAAARG
jgi:hypothetical protein